MKIVVSDWETFFDPKTYTLSTMTTESYIRDGRFEAHGCAIKWSPDLPARWFDQDEVREVLGQWDWSDTFIIHHHAQFDSLIESHHYGVHPKKIGCTLSMARLLLGNHLSVSLDAVRKHFGMAPKQTPYNLFAGKHWNELSPATQKMVADGACDEVESIWKIFGLLLKDFPREELDVVDLTVKMFTEPVLCGDINLLADIWEKEEHSKAPRFKALGITESDVQSADKFADLLRAEGIEPETKKGKNGDIYAFAKTDEFMRDLQEHDNERVRTLAEARLGAKSTLLQTRAETLGFMSRRGPMPVYLRYAGAGTLRFSGGDGCLPADTRVLVFDWQKGLTEKRIVDILADDLIWDGEAFVEHDGVVFSGYQETIEHDGIRATPAHKVYTARGSRSLASATKAGTKIMDCRQPKDWEVAAASRGEYHKSHVSVPVRKRKNSSIRRAKKR